MSTRFTFALALALALGAALVAGCGGGDGRPAKVAPAGTPEAVSAPGSATSQTHQPDGSPALPVNADLRSMVEAALADAGRRTGRDAATLKVVSAEAVTWPDGSLGCPEPGMAYTQALVPGFRIRIEASAEVLDYHAGRRGPLVLCPPGRSVEPAPGGPT